MHATRRRKPSIHFCLKLLSQHQMYFQILRGPKLSCMMRAPHPPFLKVASFQDYELVNQLGLGGFHLHYHILSSLDTLSWPACCRAVMKSSCGELGPANGSQIYAAT